jgi:hypothetical protein
MEWSSNIIKQVQQAVVDFLVDVAPLQAHWYSICLPTDDVQVNNQKILRAFPSLASLMCIDEQILKQLLVLAGLFKYHNGNYITSKHGWESLIRENMLGNVEITSFKIFNKARWLICIGSWRKKSHPPMTPKEIWSATLQGDKCVPKLKTSLITLNFAVKIGKINLPSLFPGQGISASDDSDTDDSSDISLEQISTVKEVPMTQAENANQSRNDVEEMAAFPLLRALSIDSDAKMNKLIEEIIKFRGNQKLLRFTGTNNRSQGLLVLPFLRSAKRYEKIFSKKDSIVDLLVNHVADNSKCSTHEAAECLLRSFLRRYEESFHAVALEKGIAPKKSIQKMDAVAVEAMLTDAKINYDSSRILFKHLFKHFGESYFSSEKERRKIFGNKDFPPVVSKVVLEDKTIVPFWFKRPDELLQNQLRELLKAEEVRDLKRVDLTVGGDSGGGHFRMMLKVLLRYRSGKTTSRIFQIASVCFAKDKISVFKKTVIDPIGVGLKNISEGQRFIVQLDPATGNMSLTFSPISVIIDHQIACDVPCNMYRVGDLKYYMQMLGRDGMSSCWCVWCKCHPSYWRAFDAEKESLPDEEKELWTIEKMAEHKRAIDQGVLKSAKEIKGIVDNVIWDFIEPKNYIFPVLHFEIGAVNNVLDNFYGFIEDQVEILSQDERVARNNLIICEVSLTEAKEAHDGFLEAAEMQLQFQRILRSDVSDSLKDRNLTNEERRELESEKEELDEAIAGIIRQKKNLVTNVKSKREAVAEAKKEMKKVHSKKDKTDRSVITDIENLLMERNISAASYHGGKLHGVDCRELICIAKSIFPEIEQALLRVDHPDRCDEETIKKTCALHCRLFVTLDTISSKLRKKYGEVNPEDYEVLEASLKNLQKLWENACMSFTPKIHGVLAHAIEQVRRFQGIGDILEDDLEHLHQTAARIYSCIGRIKDKTQLAFSHSKMEAKRNSIEIQEKIGEVQQARKRKFKNRNMDLDAGRRAVKMKQERDSSRMETLKDIHQQPDEKLETRHEKEKRKMLLQNQQNNS